ncbi:MAG TPA: hypothetical protein VE553_09455 [Candidatus Binatia bacterium]|jgi:bifunctional ADP-heptose synthase (sugar kinase/adenylyltransferase)|nr:hypothetical protein [Candidatus Binatia bacterium]
MTTIAKKQASEAVERDQTAVATGAAAAAMVASGAGVFVIGLLTTGTAISSELKETLNWWNPAGPLTGKTGLGVIVWLVTWYVLNRVLHADNRSLQRAFAVTLILIALGLILTFPPVFEAFE